MEYLISSMYEILNQSKEVEIWYSAIFQVAAGLSFAQTMYSFIHNDW